MMTIQDSVEFGGIGGGFSAACGGSAYKVDGSEGRCWCSSKGSSM